MSSIVIAGDTSGSVTLQAPAVSGSSVLSLPAVTDTVAGIAATQTLTNKTISGASNTLTNIALATAVTGNLPVTNLNSGTSASASTFWRGDATWATPSGSSGGMTLLSTTSLSGTNTNIAVASGYVHLYIVISNATSSSNYELYFRLNSITSNYDGTGTQSRSTAVLNYLGDSIFIATGSITSRSSSNTNNVSIFLVQNYDSATMYKIVNMTAAYLDNASTTQFGASTGLLRNNAAITSIQAITSAGSWNGGTVLIYGVK